MKNVAIYVRVSTQEQAKEGYSIDEQIDRLDAFCKAHDWNIVKRYVDAGHSGASMKRPALQELMADCERHVAEAILVYKLDRLSRSQRDTLELIENHFIANGIDFISMTENFDTSSPFGKAMIGILSVFAQLEREQIKERMAMGKNGRAKDGKWRGGGCVPIGYNYVDDHLVVNDYEAMQLREMHKLYQDGKNANQISIIFGNKGYAHKYGTWTPRRIRTCLVNPLYCGMITHGDDVYQGTHTPIISEQTYNASLAIFNNEKKKYQTVKPRRLLSGLIYCEHCHAKYTVTCYNGYEYYICYSRKKYNPRMVKDPSCKNKTWSVSKLESIVLDEIRKLAQDPSFIYECHETEEDNKESIIMAEIAKIDAQKMRFLDLYGLGNFSVDELQSKILPLQERKERLEHELETLPTASKMSTDEALGLVESFGDVVDSGDHERLRLLINSLIDKVEIDEEDITIYWRFA